MCEKRLQFIIIHLAAGIVSGMNAIRDEEPERLKAFVGWLLGAAKGFLLGMAKAALNGWTFTLLQ